MRYLYEHGLNVEVSFYEVQNCSSQLIAVFYGWRVEFVLHFKMRSLISGAVQNSRTIYKSEKIKGL